MRPSFSLLTRRNIVSPLGFGLCTIGRFYSHVVRSRSEHYDIVEDVSFVKPPFTQTFGSSTDPDMDAFMVARTKTLRPDEPPAEPESHEAFMINNKPWKLRSIIPEHNSQLTSEMKTGKADDFIVITLQRGLRKSDLGPAMRQTSSGILDSVFQWVRTGKLSIDHDEVTYTDWRHSASFLILGDWLASNDGRLVLPLLQRNPTLLAQRDRKILRQLDGNIDDKLPYECADTIIYLYSLARNLSITSLETHLAAKWRQSFDIMPEHTQVYIWALGVLNETTSIEDPLVSRLIHQLAFSVLWKADLMNTQTESSTADMYLAGIPSLSAALMRDFAPDLTFLTDRLADSMAKIVRNVAAQQSSRACDMVRAEPLMIYGDLGV